MVKVTLVAGDAPKLVARPGASPLRLDRGQAVDVVVDDDGDDDNVYVPPILRPTIKLDARGGKVPVFAKGDLQRLRGGQVAVEVRFGSKVDPAQLRRLGEQASERGVDVFVVAKE